jgi:hypothetical protein
MEKNYPTALPDFRLTKTHVKLLKHARKRIKAGLSVYVCSGIQHGVEHPEDADLNNHPVRLEHAGANLHRFIRRAINGNTYFDTWQRRNGISRSRQQVQKDRAKWIKYLLENTPRQ